MIINFLGDSITFGACATSSENTFVYKVSKLLNCKANGYGICGARIAKQLVEEENGPGEFSYYGYRVKDLDPKADITFVLGGTNDYGHGDAPIGKMGDQSHQTFYGAMEFLVVELLKKYKKEQIVFMLPLYRLDEDNPYGSLPKPSPVLSLQGYRDVMIEVLNKYDIEIFDIKDMMGRPEITDLYEDGLHPNDKGHDKMAHLIAEYVNRRMKHGL